MLCRLRFNPNWAQFFYSATTAAGGTQNKLFSTKSPQKVIIIWQNGRYFCSQANATATAVEEDGDNAAAVEDKAKETMEKDGGNADTMMDAVNIAIVGLNKNNVEKDDNGSKKFTWDEAPLHPPYSRKKRSQLAHSATLNDFVVLVKEFLDSKHTPSGEQQQLALWFGKGRTGHKFIKVQNKNVVSGQIARFPNIPVPEDAYSIMLSMDKLLSWLHKEQQNPPSAKFGQQSLILYTDEVKGTHFDYGLDICWVKDQFGLKMRPLWSGTGDEKIVQNEPKYELLLPIQSLQWMRQTMEKMLAMHDDTETNQIPKSILKGILAADNLSPPVHQLQQPLARTSLDAAKTTAINQLPEHQQFEPQHMPKSQQKMRKLSRFRQSPASPAPQQQTQRAFPPGHLQRPQQKNSQKEKELVEKLVNLLEQKQRQEAQQQEALQLEHQLVNVLAQIEKQHTQISGTMSTLSATQQQMGAMLEMFLHSVTTPTTAAPIPINAAYDQQLPTLLPLPTEQPTLEPMQQQQQQWEQQQQYLWQPSPPPSSPQQYNQEEEEIIKQLWPIIQQQQATTTMPTGQQQTSQTRQPPLVNSMGQVQPLPFGCQQQINDLREQSQEQLELAEFAPTTEENTFHQNDAHQNAQNIDEPQSRRGNERSQQIEGTDGQREEEREDAKKMGNEERMNTSENSWHRTTSPADHQTSWNLKERVPTVNQIIRDAGREKVVSTINAINKKETKDGGISKSPSPPPTMGSMFLLGQMKGAKK